MKGKLKKQEYGWAIEYMAYDEIYGSSQEIYPITKDQSKCIHEDLVDLDKFYDFEVSSTDGAVIKDFQNIPKNWIFETFATIPALGTEVPVKITVDMSQVEHDKFGQVVLELLNRYQEKSQEPINRYARL